MIPSFTVFEFFARIFAITFTTKLTMNEGTKYGKDDRHTYSVGDDIHNKSHYVFLYTLHFSLQLFLVRNQPSDDERLK